MGACASVQDRSAKERSDLIDRQIEEDSRRFRKECKILLLGSGESGKSTIVKQMKIIHQNGYTRDELLVYRTTIYRNLLESAQAIVLAMRKIGVDPVLPPNREHAEAIMDYKVEQSPNFSFSEDIAQAIHQLWQDPIIPKIMDHSSELYLMDSASYFFTEVLRIGSPGYVPTETDVLRARQKSTGIVETRFNAAGPEGQPTGPSVKTYDYEPKARGAAFDDSAWEIVPAAELQRRRGNGRLSFNWYRINITSPAPTPTPAGVASGSDRPS